MTRELGYISGFLRYAHAWPITIFGYEWLIQSTWGQTLTCADGESIYSSIFSATNISVHDTTTVPRLRRADQVSRAVDLCAQISAEEYQRYDPNLGKQKPMIKLVTSARDIDSFISICPIQGMMKMNESHTRRKRPLWMTSSPASWPSLMSPTI